MQDQMLLPEQLTAMRCLVAGQQAGDGRAGAARRSDGREASTARRPRPGCYGSASSCRRWTSSARTRPNRRRDADRRPDRHVGLSVRGEEHGALADERLATLDSGFGLHAPQTDRRPRRDTPVRSPRKIRLHESCRWRTLVAPCADRGAQDSDVKEAPMSIAVLRVVTVPAPSHSWSNSRVCTRVRRVPVRPI